MESEHHDIKGLISGMTINYAGCCHPLPGDKIVGIINEGKGITIHNSKCINVNKPEIKDHSIKLYWKKVSKSKKLYISRLRVVTANSFGVIANLISYIASQNINIVHIKTVYKTESYYELLVDLELESYKKLQEIKAYLRSFKIIFQ